MIELRKLCAVTLLVSLLAACVSSSRARRKYGSSLDNWKACSAGYCERCACIAELVGKHHEVPTSNEIARLISSVDAGGECQTDLAISVLSSIRGGDLEDMMRAVAAASDRSPLLFLQVLERNHVDKVRITLIVRMLPLYSVDNQTERRRIVRERITSLRSVMNVDLRGVRDIAVEALTALDKELH